MLSLHDIICICVSFESIQHRPLRLRLKNLLLNYMSLDLRKVYLGYPNNFSSDRVEELMFLYCSTLICVGGGSNLPTSSTRNISQLILSNVPNRE